MIPTVVFFFFFFALIFIISISGSCIFYTAVQVRGSTKTEISPIYNILTLPAQVLPCNPISNADIRLPRCGGPRFEPSLSATVLMAAAAWALVVQDWDCNVSWSNWTISDKYSLIPPSVPEKEKRNICIVLYSYQPYCTQKGQNSMQFWPFWVQ